MAERNLIEAIIKYTNSSEELQFLATEYDLIDNLIIQEKLFERRWQEVESEMPMGEGPLSPREFLNFTDQSGADDDEISQQSAADDDKNSHQPEDDDISSSFLCPTYLNNETVSDAELIQAEIAAGNE